MIKLLPLVVLVALIGCGGGGGGNSGQIDNPDPAERTYAGTWNGGIGATGDNRVTVGGVVTLAISDNGTVTGTCASSSLVYAVTGTMSNTGYISLISSLWTARGTMGFQADNKLYGNLYVRINSGGGEHKAVTLTK